VTKTPRPHRTLEARKAQRAVGLIACGRSPNAPAEMLDLYLGGDSMTEIAQAYGLRVGTAYRSITKEALFRLMALHSAEQLEEIQGIENA
jgi:hypothetical protein